MTTIDAHTHIFPDVVRSDRNRFFENEPEYKLLYDSAKSKMAGVDDLVAMLDEQQIDMAVAFGFPWHSMDTVKRHNEYILEAVQRHPQRLIGFCCLDPLHAEAPIEAEHCLKAGAQGIGELAFYRSGIDDRCLDALDPIMALARQYDRAVMLHTNEPVGHQYPGKSPNTLAQIYALAKRYSQNRLILAHWGGGIFLFTLLKREIQDVLANVWYDTAASPYLYQEQIYQEAIARAGLDKIILGSDYPLLKADRYRQEMTAGGLTESQQLAICGANAARVLKLSANHSNP